jgi:hypothetical protein
MTDPRRAEARRLRSTERMTLQQLRDHFGVSRDTLADWLWNEPTPDWTRRPNAKDELRKQAVQLRIEGRTVPEIAAELAVAKSTAYQWVKHLPLDATIAQGQARRRRFLSGLFGDLRAPIEPALLEGGGCHARHCRRDRCDTGR